MSKDGSKSWGERITAAINGKKKKPEKKNTYEQEAAKRKKEREKAKRDKENRQKRYTKQQMGE